MFGAPAGGFAVPGHHGFEVATVLPMVPPNGVPPFSLMTLSLFSPTAAVEPSLILAQPVRVASNDNPNYDYGNYEMQALMPSPSSHFDLPGVTPSRQKRSRETTLALLEAGASLLRTRSLSELSIEVLCSKVGATVGAFYSRFESKEAYFNALIALAAQDGEHRLAGMDRPARDTGLDELCHLIVSGVIGWIRTHEGVLRAVLQHDDTRPDKWTTFKGLARATTQHATPLLLPAMGKGRKAAKTRAIAFGFQVVLGTLINAILNDPGPLALRDSEIETRLADCLVLLLKAEM
jgi:AcrR family transcriptional regulator